MARTKVAIGGHDSVVRDASSAGRALLIIAVALVSLCAGCRTADTRVAREPLGSAEFAKLYRDVLRAGTLEERRVASGAIGEALLPMPEEGLLLYILMDVRLTPQERMTIAEGIGTPFGITVEAFSEMWDFPSGVWISSLLDRVPDSSELLEDFELAKRLLRIEWLGRKDAAHPKGTTILAFPTAHLHSGEWAPVESTEQQAMARSAGVDAFLALYERSLAASSEDAKKAIASELKAGGFPREEESWLRWTLIDVGMDSGAAHELAGGDSAFVKAVPLSKDKRYEVRLYSNGMRLVVDKGQSSAVHEAGLHFLKTPQADRHL